MLLSHALRLPLDPAAPDVVAFVGGGGKSTTLFRLAAEIVRAGRRVVTTTTTRIFSGQIALAPAHLRATGLNIDWRALEQALDDHSHCLLISETGSHKASGVDPHLVDALARRSADLDLAAVLVEADGSAQRPVKAPASHEPVIPDATTLLVPVLGLDAIGLPLDDPFVHRPVHLRRLLGVADPVTRFTPQMAVRLLLHPQGGQQGRPPSARLLPLLNKAENPLRRVVGRLVAHGLAAASQPSLLGSVGASGGEPVQERWGPTAAVVLAAGASRRMGAPKQLLAIDGETLAVRAARLALDSGASQTWVVTGAYRDGVEAALASLQAQAGNRLHLVHNPAWETGQASSIHAALRTLPADCQAALFLPVDQPRLPAALLRRLGQCWRTGSDRVATLVDGEVRGAPAVFDRGQFPALLAVRGDQGARPLLKADRAAVTTVPAPAFSLDDVDTPEDWRRFVP